MAERRTVWLKILCVLTLTSPTCSYTECNRNLCINNPVPLDKGAFFKILNQNFCTNKTHECAEGTRCHTIRNDFGRKVNFCSPIAECHRGKFTAILVIDNGGIGSLFKLFLSNNLTRTKSLCIA